MTHKSFDDEIHTEEFAILRRLFVQLKAEAQRGADPEAAERGAKGLRKRAGSRL
jgi:hypothetical protein